MQVHAEKKQQNFWGKEKNASFGSFVWLRTALRCDSICEIENHKCQCRCNWKIPYNWTEIPMFRCLFFFFWCFCAKQTAENLSDFFPLLSKQFAFNLKPPSINLLNFTVLHASYSPRQKRKKIRTKPNFNILFSDMVLRLENMNCWCQCKSRHK